MELKANVTAVTVFSLLIPGTGQISNGQVGKGLAMIALWIVILFIWAPLVLILDFYAAWDAYEGAKQLNSQEAQKTEAIAKTAEGEISAKDMVIQIEKLNNLAKANLLNAQELTDRKAKVIQLLAIKKPTSSTEDFLIAMIPLVQASGLNSNEVEEIKALLRQREGAL